MPAGTRPNTPRPALLAEAVYGLPEFYRDKVRDAALVANPGCYPTAANLAIRPLVESGKIDRSAGIVCDAKSGVSGAGRKPSLKTSFCEVTENFSAYSILGHRHVPEVLQNSGLERTRVELHRASVADRPGHPRDRLLPLDGVLRRGACCAIYEAAYRGEPFIRLYDAGVMPDLRAVQRTNFCDIGVSLRCGRPGAASWSPRSTIWSRAPPARRCRT